MITKIDTDLEKRILFFMENFLHEDDINKLQNQIVIFINPVKRYFVFMNPETSERISDMGDFFFKGGVKVGTYNENLFPRLNSNGFQYIGNSIRKNYLNFNDEIEFENFINNGINIDSVINFKCKIQIAVKLKDITIGWAYCKDGHVQHQFPKSVLKLYKEKKTSRRER